MKSNSPAGDYSRRHFLKTTAKTGLGLSLAANLAIERAAYAAGDDTIKLALVGCGGRGSGAADQALSTTANVKLVAVADAFEPKIDSSLKELVKNHPAKVDPATIHRYVGFDADKTAIAAADIAILATPPGFRPLHFEEAVAQGKNAFLEKPVATDAAGVRRILAANEIAKQKNLKVGTGFQRHNSSGYIEALKRVRDGAIGEILAMRVYWRGGSRGGQAKLPNETELQYQIRNWYFFTYLSGDHIVEQHCHNIDVANWFKGTHPVRAIGVGGRQSRTAKTCGQIFDHHSVEFEYEDGTRMFSQCSQFPAKWGRVAEALQGSKGTADLNNDRHIFAIKGPTPWRYEGTPKNPYQVEHDDLFAAIRNGDTYNEVENAAHSTMTAIMGRMSTYSGTEVEWKDALACPVLLMPLELTWESKAPVQPDAEGFYPVAHPGKTTACEDVSWTS